MSEQQHDTADYARLRNLHRPGDLDSLRQAALQLRREHALTAHDIGSVLGLNVDVVEQLLGDCGEARR